jgi:hypothetical protein
MQGEIVVGLTDWAKKFISGSSRWPIDWLSVSGGYWLPLYRYTLPNGWEVDEFVQCLAEPYSLYMALRQAHDTDEGEVLDWSLWTDDEMTF